MTEVKVKPLKWEANKAASPFGFYVISSFNTGGHYAAFWESPHNPYPKWASSVSASRDTAKGEAEKHHKRQVLKLLEQ